MRPLPAKLRARAAVWPSAALGALAIAGCPGSASEPPVCQGEMALSATGATALVGTSLAAKQLALTFDDGPGSRTLELSAWLAARGIKAVFFVNGQCFGAGNPCRAGGAATSAAAVLAQLTADGHLVANHTQNHYDLTADATHFPAGATGDAAIVKQLVDTDALIAPHVPGGRFLFRAPFGSFGSRPYDVLRASAMDKYVGHVGWDVGAQYVGNDATGYAADWYCWQNASTTTKKCGDRYINEIQARGRGIVLFHDADYGNVANTNPSVGKGNTIDMVKYMVPLLEAAGYTFVRADDVPAIQALLPAVPDAGVDAATDAGDDAAMDAGDDAAMDAGEPPTHDAGGGGVGTGAAPPDPCAPAPAATQSRGPSPHAH